MKKLITDNNLLDALTQFNDMVLNLKGITNFVMLFKLYGNIHVDGFIVKIYLFRKEYYYEKINYR